MNAKIISILVGAVVVGGGAIAYFNYNGGAGSSDVAQASVSKLANVKSVEYTAEITGRGDVENLLGENGAMIGASAGESSFAITLDGKSIFNTNNPDDVKSALSINVKTNALGDKEETIGAEVRALGQKVYFRLANLPESAGFFGMLGDGWITTDVKQAAEDSKVETKNSNAFDIGKIKSALKKASIIKMTGTIGEEEVNGVKTTHYTFEVDKDGIKSLYKDILAADKNMTASERTEALKDLEEALKSITFSDGHIWIDNDELPRRISLHMAISGESEGHFTYTINFKSFDSEVNIETPTNAKTIEEVMSGMFGGMFGGVGAEAVPSASTFEDGTIPEGFDMSQFLPAGFDMSQFDY